MILKEAGSWKSPSRYGRSRQAGKSAASLLSVALMLMSAAVITTPSVNPQPNTVTNSVQWQDDFESYSCNSFPSTWVLRYDGAGTFDQHVDCSNAKTGSQ